MTGRVNGKPGNAFFHQYQGPHVSCEMISQTLEARKSCNCQSGLLGHILFLEIPARIPKAAGTRGRYVARLDTNAPPHRSIALRGAVYNVERTEPRIDRLGTDCQASINETARNLLQRHLLNIHLVSRAKDHTTMVTTDRRWPTARTHDSIHSVFRSWPAGVRQLRCPRRGNDLYPRSQVTGRHGL